MKQKPYFFSEEIVKQYPVVIGAVSVKKNSSVAAPLMVSCHTMG